MSVSAYTYVIDGQADVRGWSGQGCDGRVLTSSRDHRLATVAVGKAGATNAAVLAAQILAVGDAAIASRLDDYRRGLAEKVERAAAELEQPR